MEVGTKGRIVTTGHSRMLYDTFSGARKAKYDWLSSSADQGKADRS